MTAPRINLTRRQPEPEPCACHPQQLLSPQQLLLGDHHGGAAATGAAQVAPPPLVSVDDVQRSAGAVFTELDEIRLQLDGLELLAQSNVLAAPLRATLDVVRARAAELSTLAQRGADQLRGRDEESTRWATTVGFIRSVAAGFPIEDSSLAELGRRVGRGVDALLEVQRLLEQRDAARDLAARLEAENADLVAAKVDAAGLRAYLDEIEIGLNTWRGNGKLGEDAVRRLRRKAAAAQLAGRDAAGAELVASVFDEQRCRACGCTDEDCSGCIERTGQPCHWVEPDLCSACLTATGSRQPAGGDR